MTELWLPSWLWKFNDIVPEERLCAHLCRCHIECSVDCVSVGQCDGARNVQLVSAFRASNTQRKSEQKPSPR